MARQKIYQASSVGVAALLALALVLMVNWLSYRHYVRADWTSSKMYSLSDKSLNVLKGVGEDVQVIVFMTGSTPMYAETKELLARYQAAAPKLKVEYIDPDRDPLRTRTLAQQFGVTAANTVVFAAAGRQKYVTSDQLAEYDYSGMQMGQPPKMKAFKGEEQFTAAILGVVNPRVPKIYFTSGHGERDPDGLDEEALSQFKEALKRDNLEVATVSLLSGSVPPDCDLVVVAGPAAPFADNEKAALQAYLDKGGRALILLDPVLGGQMRPSGLEAMLAGFGAVVNEDLVTDPSRRVLLFGPEAVYVTDFRAHPAVKGLQGLAILLPVTRSVTTATAAGFTQSVLLTTSADGFGERDLEPSSTGQLAVKKDPTDTQGPVSLAVAIEREKDKDSGPRLVVIGNAAFLANGWLANAGNLNLGMNAVNWLVTREEALGIAPRSPEQVQLFLDAAQMRGIYLVSLLAMPGAAIALGVAVWWRRRR